MQKKNICVVTFPISAAGVIPLSNLLEILYPLSNKLYLITGNKGYYSLKDDSVVHSYAVSHKKGTNLITKMINYLNTQLKISYIILKLENKVDNYILFIGGEGLILPLITIKLLQKKVILAPADYTIKLSKNVSSRILLKMINVNRLLCNKIILHSPILIKEWDLENYTHKINIAHEYFIDYNTFKLMKKYDVRDNLIGYVGRLDKEKGVLNFIQSIPKILDIKKDLKFIIVGDGPLFGEIERYIDTHNLKDKVKLLGWIPHEKLSGSLNELKLLVIPSYMESGPIIALESMACGTPIVATKVGQILNMIVDGQHGFIMDNNSPDCITENILRVLEYESIPQIICNAQKFVMSEFTYEIAINNYKYILEDF